VSLKEQLNHLGKNKTPCLFIINYDMSKYDIFPLEQLPNDIKYELNSPMEQKTHKFTLEKQAISFTNYQKKFKQIQKNISDGNTYLINLTAPTKIKNSIDLLDIYKNARAPYKLYYKDQFVCFSPEKFCTIQNNSIYTYPMKGTIDADIPNAHKTILDDPKELAEHTMVVDLLRNDLSQVASKVRVKRFRYIEKIHSGKNELLQVSSEIEGHLEKDWQNRLGEIVFKMLPAGSITGAPKRKTVEILKKVEGYDRGFYTGVFGLFDGKSLKSAVMIRFIEKTKAGEFIYKSGGGLTCDSDPLKEYKELIQKVYIP
jgi:para-aminobenzoate synthetase component 1